MPAHTRAYACYFLIYMLHVTFLAFHTYSTDDLCNKNSGPSTMGSDASHGPVRSSFCLAHRSPAMLVLAWTVPLTSLPMARKPPALAALQSVTVVSSNCMQVEPRRQQASSQASTHTGLGGAKELQLQTQAWPTAPLAQAATDPDPDPDHYRLASIHADRAPPRGRVHDWGAMSQDQ